MNSNDDRIRELEEKIRQLEAENLELKRRLLQAKDPDPVQRVSFRRVLKLAQSACLSVVREGSKIVVKLGDKVRVFKRLKEAWEFLSADDWSLTDLFSEPVKKAKGLCKFCTQPIRWLPNLSGKWKPFNHDNSPHRCREFRESLTEKLEAVPMS